MSACRRSRISSVPDKSRQLPRQAAGFCVVSVGLLLYAAPAYPESEQVCRAYADEAVAAQRHNKRRLGCGRRGDMWSENWSGHFDWCRGQSGAVVATERRKRIDELTECTRRADICRQYADGAVAAQKKNLTRPGCARRGDMWSENWRGHFDWCQSSPGSLAAAETRRRIEELGACTCHEYTRRMQEAAQGSYSVCGVQAPAGDANAHYAWCLANQDQAVERELQIDWQVRACRQRQPPAPPPGGPPPVDRGGCCLLTTPPQGQWSCGTPCPCGTGRCQQW